MADYQRDIVLIKGKAGSGTGFIANFKGKKFLVTNAHVMAGIKAPTFSLIDGNPLKLGLATIAVAHDLVIIAVVEGGAGIPVSEIVDREAVIQDSILVLGNPGAGEVVTEFQGKLLGVGPTRVEISAQVEHGSSGSPIILVKNGKVIGVVSDARVDRLLTGDKQLRRFGYRLDSVRSWEAIDWPRFYGEAAALEKIERTSDEIAMATEEAGSGLSYGRLGHRKYAYETLAIRTAVDGFHRTVQQGSTDGNRALKNLLESLRLASKSDVSTATSTFGYDYFKRRLADETTARTALLNAIAKAIEK